MQRLSTAFTLVLASLVAVAGCTDDGGGDDGGGDCAPRGNGNNCS